MTPSSLENHADEAKSEAKSEAKAAPTTDANAKAKSAKDKPAGKKKKGE